MWLFYLLFSLIFPFNTQAATTDISATIATNTPPTITFVTPVNGQTGVPSNADIVVEISNPTYGVDINSVEIIINGVTYTPSSPRVSTTGNILDYTFTVTPYDPLFTDQANTVLVKAANLNGNYTQSSIVFNVPVVTPTPTLTPTNTPTLTPTPTGTITPTPTSSSSPTETPTPIPTSTTSTTVIYYPTATPKTTQKPTITSFPSCPTCPASLNIPTLTPTPIFTPTPDISSPIIAFIQPTAKGLLKTNNDFILQVSDLDSGVNKDTIKITFNQQVFTLVNTQMSISGDSQSYRVTLKNNFQLTPNTEYKISVSAFDFNQNGISNSIFFQVVKPFPYWSFLLIIPLGFLVWFVIYLIKYSKTNNGQTLGIIFNSLTLEPLPFITVKINKKRFISNIYGILSVKLKSGNYHLDIQDPNFAYPSKHPDEPLDYPQNYQGQNFDFNPQSPPFFNIPLDPYKNKNTFYKISQFFSGKPGVITNSSGQPAVGLKISLIETKFNTLIASRITDNDGQYRFLVPHGRYQLVIFGTDNILDTIDTRQRTHGHTLINKNYIIK